MQCHIYAKRNKFVIVTDQILFDSISDIQTLCFWSKPRCKFFQYCLLQQIMNSRAKGKFIAINAHRHFPYILF